MNITDKQMKMLRTLLKYSSKYELNIQFWPDQTACFIEKEGVELTSFGGSFDDAIQDSIDYLDRITQNDLA